MKGRVGEIGGMGWHGVHGAAYILVNNKERVAPLELVHDEGGERLKAGDVQSGRYCLSTRELQRFPIVHRICRYQKWHCEI